MTAQNNISRTKNIWKSTFTLEILLIIYLIYVYVCVRMKIFLILISNNMLI